MLNALRRGFAAACLTLSALAATAVADTPVPPAEQMVDANGVDLVSGTFRPAQPSITIGVPGSGGLTYERRGHVPGIGSLFGVVTESGSQVTTTVMGQSLRWTRDGSAYVAAGGQQGTLTGGGGSYTLTLPDGTIARFPSSNAVTIPTRGTWISSLTTPTGETITWHYARWQFCPHYNGTGCSNWVYGIRTTAVTNSFGYMIKFEYPNAVVNASYTSPAPTRVIAINRTVEDCPISAQTCTGLTRDWPSLVFNGDGTLTDHLGRRLTVSGAGIKYPDETAYAVSVDYHDTGEVSAVTAAGQTTRYAYSETHAERTVTVTRGGLSEVYKFQIGSDRLVHHEDTAGLVTRYSWSRGRLSYVGRPGGGYTF